MAATVLCGAVPCGAVEHHDSTRERPERSEGIERTKEWGEAPDAVVLVSEANESSSELVSDGVLAEL